MVLVKQRLSALRTQERKAAYVHQHGERAWVELLERADIEGQVEDESGLTRRELLRDKRRYADWMAAQREAGRDPTKEFESLPRE